MLARALWLPTILHARMDRDVHLPIFAPWRFRHRAILPANEGTNSSQLRTFINLAESAVSEAGEPTGPVFCRPERFSHEFLVG